MKDFMCTIILQPAEIVADSTFGRLIAKWPQAAFHDKINRLFAGIDDQAIDPIMVDTLLPDYAQIYNEEGEAIGKSYIDALVEVLGPILYAEDRSRPLHIKSSVLSELYRHPVYQQFIEDNNPTQEEQPNNINKEP